MSENERPEWLVTYLSKTPALWTLHPDLTQAFGAIEDIAPVGSPNEDQNQRSHPVYGFNTKEGLSFELVLIMDLESVPSDDDSEEEEYSEEEDLEEEDPEEEDLEEEDPEEEDPEEEDPEEEDSEEEMPSPIEPPSIVKSQNVPGPSLMLWGSIFSPTGKYEGSAGRLLPLRWGTPIREQITDILSVQWQIIHWSGHSLETFTERFPPDISTNAGLIDQIMEQQEFVDDCDARQLTE